MHIKELKLINFRNYDNLDIDFSPGINFIIGNNGTGKTNIIEAISITSNIKSFRGISDNEIIKWGADSYFCSTIVGDNINKKFEAGFGLYNGLYKKKLKLDDIEIKKSSEYFGRLLCVIFSPSDIDIINGAPDIRRRFFDSIISKLDISYIDTLNEFKKILINRNRVLKFIKEKKIKLNNELDIWNELFAEKSSIILKKRIEFNEKFNDIFRKSYRNIASTDEVPVIKYSMSTKSFDKESILDILSKRRNKDIILGTTGLGPQRDDYIIINSENIEFTNFASQGQRRTAAISLKISECDIIEKHTGKKCVIIVDDIFSELDEKRRYNMIDLLKRGNQVIFTMVDFASIYLRDLTGHNIFKIENNGQVKKT